jgi:Icc protein
MRWLAEQLEAAQSDSYRPVVFMHAYPRDLRAGGEEVAGLFTRSCVAFVGTGHTHYNELVNHAGVIYAATRSTGEVEEGPPGFSLGVLDGSVVGWHFKPVDTAWPLVLITSPSEQRLITDPSAVDQVPSGEIRVRAKVFGGMTKQVAARADRGSRIQMTQSAAHVWTGVIPDVASGLRVLDVEATIADGKVKRDTIQVVVGSGDTAAGGIDRVQRQSFEPVGYWPERSLLGTQL